MKARQGRRYACACGRMVARIRDGLPLLPETLAELMAGQRTDADRAALLVGLRRLGMVQ